ncbi:MAG TPA: hypothetical protein VGD67_10160 [Pseudonocardiaceae bacterium]
MWPQVVALGLFLLGVALGVTGNWLKPPARMGGRAIVAVFTFLLICAAGITYFNAAKGNNGGDPGARPNDRGTSDSATPITTPDAGLTLTSAPTTPGSEAPTGGGGPVAPVTTGPAGPQNSTPAGPPAPCIVGSWTLTSIVDYIPDDDQTVRMSYDGGWEIRTYEADGTFTIMNDWRERGYDNTLNEWTVHSIGRAEGRYQLNGSTAVYSPVSSVGNWTLAVEGDVRQQSSVIFSSGEETITCSSGALRISAEGSYEASYTRK